MTTLLKKRNIRKVVIIDDKHDAQEAMAESVRDAQFEPVIQAPTTDSLEKFVQQMVKSADAAVFDHRLSPCNYASFSGAAAVARLYDLNFPALLVTSWGRADIDTIRQYRRKIPILIPSGSAEPNVIKEGINQCLCEFARNYSKERRPWRTLVRVEEVNTNFVFVVIPSWNPNMVVRIPMNLIPQNVKPISGGSRLIAKVNIGALSEEELYFDGFETAESPKGDYAKLLLP